MAQLTSSDIIERANQAARCLEDPTMQKAFEGVRQSLLVAMEASQMGDRDGHHEIALSLQALRSVRRILEKWVADGQVEKKRNG